MMKKWFSITLIAFLSLFVLIAPKSELYAAPAKPLVLKYGHGGPNHHVLGKTAFFFKDYVENYTDGAIKIEVYPMSQLGGERVMFNAVLTSTLDMATIGAPIQATAIPEMNLLFFPFVIANEDIAWAVVRDKEFRSKLFSIMRKKGIEPLGFTIMCGRGFMNTKRPIRSPEDVKGLRMRVMEGNISTDTFRALGAKTRTIPFPEVYTALQQGLIDGEDNNTDTAVMMKFTEVEKFSTNTNHTFQQNPLIVSNKAWNKLTDEQKKIFREASRAADIFSQREYRKDKVEGWKIAREKYGVEVIEKLTPEERAALQNSVKPVIEKYRKTIPVDLFDLYMDLAKKYEKKFLKQ